MMPGYVCVSNFGVGGDFGFNRVDRFVKFSHGLRSFCVVVYRFDRFSHGKLRSTT